MSQTVPRTADASLNIPSPEINIWNEATEV